MVRQDSPARSVWRVMMLALLFSMLQISWQTLRGTHAEQLVIHHAIVVPTVTGINLLTPHLQAKAIGPLINTASVGLEIQSECVGMEFLFLLIAAFCVVPLAPRYRVMGCLLGSAVVFLANEMRLLALFYAARSDAGRFETLDTIFAPIGVVLLVSLYFYAWLAYSNSNRIPAATP